MPPINPQLLDRLETKLGVGRRQLDSRITTLAHAERIERLTAALILAADHGISITRYSTPEQRAAMKGGANGFGSLTSIFSTPSRETSQPQKQPTKPVRSRQAKAINDNSVFVVHGRDTQLTKSIFDFLRAIGLNPLEWERAVLMPKDNNPHLQQILDTAMSKVQAVLVVFSPDDDACLTPSLRARKEPVSETKLKGQPRQNVLFEAGLAIGNHAKKTVVVQVGTLRPISDIFGRHITRLTNATEKRIDLINRLENIGCKVDRRGTFWMKTGDFTSAREKKR
jgi:predicted nucleotide-binding protein